MKLAFISDPHAGSVFRREGQSSERGSAGGRGGSRAFVAAGNHETIAASQQAGMLRHLRRNVRRDHEGATGEKKK